MISYFENGVKQTRPNKEIDIYELVEIIRHNPKIDLINEIRKLKRDGNDNYKLLKKGLPNITPNCLVSKRNVSTDINSLNGFSHFNSVNGSSDWVCCTDARRRVRSIPAPVRYRRSGCPASWRRPACCLIQRMGR